MKFRTLMVSLMILTFLGGCAQQDSLSMVFGRLVSPGEVIKAGNAEVVITEDPQILEVKISGTEEVATRSVVTDEGDGTLFESRVDGYTLATTETHEDFPGDLVEYAGGEVFVKEDFTQELSSDEGNFTAYLARSVAFLDDYPEPILGDADGEAFSVAVNGTVFTYLNGETYVMEEI